VCAKTAELHESEVKPRAAEIRQKTKPKVVAAARDVRDIARETDARTNPGAFAAKLKRRFIDRKGRAGRRRSADAQSQRAEERCGRMEGPAASS
jgi:hypothetical protein